MHLWYKNSAAGTNEALPLGNGKLAALVYGGANLETIQLDDATFWSGEKSEHNNRTDTPQLLQKLRELLLAENYAEADRLGHAYVGVKNNYGTHMPFANLTLRQEGVGEVTNLRRSLDIMTGMADTQFDANGTTWKREYFVSNPAKLMAVKYENSGSERFCISVQVNGIDNNVHTEGVVGNDLQICGNAYESLHSDGHTGIAARGRIRILTDGTLRQKSTWARIENASWLVLLCAVETTMFSQTPDDDILAILDSGEKCGYDALKRQHVADVMRLMNRVELTLPDSDASAMPTDVRIAAYAKNKGGDAALDALIFQYGRYVLMSSSREDSPLPTHMGGIWNDNIYNKQDSTQDMHIDMNVEMQYWPAYPCALAECANPLDAWIANTLVPAGQTSAKEEYAASGWAAHVTSNPWGYTALGWAYNWGSFTFGGMWCATLMWDRYEYSQDKEYLKTVWPVLRGCAAFLNDYLFYNEKTGEWMTGPSYSPENHFATNGAQYTLSLSPTCDIVLVREMLSIVQRAAHALHLENDDMAVMAKERIAHLPPYQIGRHGQIQEWYHDFDEPIPNHRHSSHLLGLYPFSQITAEETPALARAAEKSMQRRYVNFEETSWGYVQFMSMYARLHQGDAAMRVMADNVTHLAKPNLTFVMPEYVAMWGGTWELDGNTGLSAAYGELLAQCRFSESSRQYHIQLLPALPSAWHSGTLKGYLLRGGYQLDMTWQDGKITQVMITATAEMPFTVLSNGEKVNMERQQNHSDNQGCAVFLFDCAK